MLSYLHYSFIKQMVWNHLSCDIDLSWPFFEQLLLLYAVDCIAVVLKHMILLKQNRWPPEIYSNYTALLKRDYLLTVQHSYNLDISFDIFF